MIQELAHAFEATAVFPDGEIKKVSLSDYKGQWVLLFFYPLNFTFVCPTEIISFAERQSAFAAFDCQLLACSCDSIYTHLAWNNMPKSEGGLGKIGIPLVSDFNKVISQKYGVLLADGTPLRSSFLISPSGENNIMFRDSLGAKQCIVVGYIRQASINDDSVGRDVDEALRLLQTLQTSDSIQSAASTTNIEIAKVEAAQYTADCTLEPQPLDYTRVRFGPRKAARSWFDPIKHLVSRYKQQLQAQPLVTKAVTAGVISAIGELLGAWIRSRSTVATATTTIRQFTPTLASLRRVAVFFLYGICVAGPFFHWWYSRLEAFTRRLQLSPAMKLALQLVANQLAMTPPFLLVTLFFLQLTHTFSLEKMLATVKKAYSGALWANWKVWTVAQAINFAFVPLDYRVLFGNIIALWWNIYLSLSASG